MEQQAIQTTHRIELYGAMDYGVLVSSIFVPAQVVKDALTAGGKYPIPSLESEDLRFVTDEMLEELKAPLTIETPNGKNVEAYDVSLFLELLDAIHEVIPELGEDITEYEGHVLGYGINIYEFMKTLRMF